MTTPNTAGKVTWAESWALRSDELTAFLERPLTRRAQRRDATALRSAQRWHGERAPDTLGTWRAMTADIVVGHEAAADRTNPLKPSGSGFGRDISDPCHPQMPFERPGASNADDEANDGRPPLARSSKPKTFSDTPKLALTLEEAAAELSVSTATIRRMITPREPQSREPGRWSTRGSSVIVAALEEFLNASLSDAATSLPRVPPLAGP